MNAPASAVVRRLAGQGIAVSVYARDRAALDAVRREASITTPRGVKAFCQALRPPRTVLLCTSETALVHALARHVAREDCVVDCVDDDLHTGAQRARLLAARGAQVADVGLFTAPGSDVFGFGLAVGGEEAAFERLRPLAGKLAMGSSSGASEMGVVHAGPAGSGRFLKALQGLLLEGTLAGSQAALKNLAQAPASLAFPLTLASAWTVGAQANARVIELCRQYLALVGGDRAPPCPAVDLARMALATAQAAAGYLGRIQELLRTGSAGA